MKVDFYNSNSVRDMTNTMTFFQSNIALYEELLRKEEYQGEINRNIALISTPRSGSTFFSHVVHKSGAFGMPAEWFGKKQIRAFCMFAGIKEADFDLQVYMNFIYRKSASNGTFSAKIHVNHYVDFKKRGIDLLEEGWSHLFQIERRDKQAQAVSLARAIKTNVWQSGDLPTAEDTSTEKDVALQLAWLFNMQNVFDESIHDRVIDSFYYEDFVGKDFEENFSRFAKLSGTDIDPMTFSAPPNLSKQSSTNINQKTTKFLEWLRQIPR